jgi:AbrB family looped-hinge helix DNA binding protein
MDVMALARSRLTAQGQISIPAEVRRRLGLTPGSVVEWDAEGDRVFVRRVGKYTWDDIHKAIFPDGPPRRRSIKEMDEGIAEYMRQKYARR